MAAKDKITRTRPGLLAAYEVCAAVCVIACVVSPIGPYFLSSEDTSKPNAC
ncbi:MAG: hypothetical protein WBR26_08450 [Candidatus Acidiferrum sp.]